MADVAEHLGLPSSWWSACAGMSQHALLTGMHCARGGLEFAGWVANKLAEEMPFAARISKR
jgi:dethiobiotin synthetase